MRTERGGRCSGPAAAAPSRPPSSPNIATKPLPPGRQFLRPVPHAKAGCRRRGWLTPPSPPAPGSPPPSLAARSGSDPDRTDGVRPHIPPLGPIGTKDTGSALATRATARRTWADGHALPDRGVAPCQRRYASPAVDKDATSARERDTGEPRDAGAGRARGDSPLYLRQIGRVDHVRLCLTVPPAPPPRIGTVSGQIAAYMRATVGLVSTLRH